MVEAIEGGWGEGVLIELFAPSYAQDEQTKELWSRFQRLSASPGMAAAVIRALGEIDARAVLPAIRVPTLILHRTDELAVPVAGSRCMAEHISGARLVELPGADHIPFFGNQDEILDEVEEFLTGERRGSEPDRVLATVLFTDIVGSTERAAELGDRRWRDLLERHDALVRREVERFRGRLVKSTGDGALASFDGPARGVRCAAAIAAGVRPLGLEVRAGLHTGECELIGEDLGGIAVHTGARVAAGAEPGEVLVSSTVKDLVAGSGIVFEDRGVHSLKGVPGEWGLFSARDL